jgi:hypothetical protein
MWDKSASKGGQKVPVKSRKYRVIIDDGLGGLEQEMNELAQQGFRAILMAMNEDTVIAVTMERTEEQAG